MLESADQLMICMHFAGNGTDAMPTLTVRNLEDATMERLRRRAETHRRSLEAEVREILSRAAGPDGDGLVAEIRAIHDRILARRGGVPLPTDSVSLLAAVRDRT